MYERWLRGLSCRAQVGLAEGHNPTSPNMAKKSRRRISLRLSDRHGTEVATFLIASYARFTWAGDLFDV